MRPRVIAPSAAHALALALLATLAGCGACGACGAGEGGDEPAEPSPRSETGGESESEGEGTGATDEGPPPKVRVAAEAAEIEPGFVPVVQSRGDEPAKIARELTVERNEGGEWSKVATVSLRFSCDEPPKDECVTLIPGAELRPPRWNAREGDGAQCDASGGDPAPEGTYRFVARSCNGNHTLPGDTFER